MNLDNEIISNADLERITGYKIPSKQSQCLRDAGIFLLKDETEDHAQPGRISIIL